MWLIAKNFTHEVDKWDDRYSNLTSYTYNAISLLDKLNSRDKSL
jgi:hypothetical protein